MSEFAGGMSSAPALHPLSPEQRAAVERTGQDVCVVAGPGSGKTRVLTERFAWLMEQRGLDPARILAITFTEKAAIEIKSRLVKRFAADAERRRAIERAPVSTIDGLCARLLREHAIAASLSPDFSVLDQPQAESMQRQAAEQALDDLFAEHPAEMRRLLEALDLATQDDGPQQDLAAALLNVYDAMRVAGVKEIPEPRAADSARILDATRAVLDDIVNDPHPGNTPRQKAAIPNIQRDARVVRALLAEPATDAHFTALNVLIAASASSFVNNTPSRFAFKAFKDEGSKLLLQVWIAEYYAGLHKLLREAILRIDRTYRSLKRAQAVLDFGDLEEQMVRLLESDTNVRRQVQGQFDQVLMDELQDTNRLQWRLLRLLCGEAALPPGSDDLGRLFAVGDINQSIYGFRHAEPEVFASFRDGLEQAGCAIDDLTGNYRSRAEVLEIVAATLDGQPGIEPRHLIARRAFSPSETPVVEVLQGIGDSAVKAEAALVAERVRELVASGHFRYRDCAVLARTLAGTNAIVDAFDQADIPFLVSAGRGFLETRECRDLLLLLAALVNPLDGIALYGVLRGPLFGIADETLAALRSEGWRKLFEREFGEIRRLMGSLPPDRLVAQVLDRCEFLAQMQCGSARGNRIRANVDKLLAWLRREFHRRPRPLAELLADLEAMRDAQNVAEAPPPDAGDVVSVMTVHAAKGLEYPVVFLSALHKGPERRKPAIMFSAADGLGIRWRHPLSGKGAPDAAHAAQDQADKLREEREANRLLYVAMTRAEDRLILTFAERRNPSPWVKLVTAAHPIDISSDIASAPTPELTEQATQDLTVPVDPALLQAPPATGQYDSVSAVTSIAEFAACPRRYFLGRYLGLNSRPTMRADSLHDEFSTLNEEMASEASFTTDDHPLRTAPTSAIDLGLAVHRLLSGLDLEPDTLHDAVEQEARALADRFHQSEWGRRAAEATRTGREFDVLFAIEDPASAPDKSFSLDMLLSGQIDLWFEHDGELILVDYKTDRTETAVESYALQLRLYALGLERYLGRRPDKALLYYLRSNRVHEVSLTSPDFTAAGQQVARFMNAQQSLEYPLSTGDHCRRCSFFGQACPAGQNERADPRDDPDQLSVEGAGAAGRDSGGEETMPDLFWPTSFSQEPTTGDS